MEQPLALEGTREELARSYRERGWWLPERLTDHVRLWAATRADALALVDESERLTWADLWGRTVATADALGELGVGERDVVSTQLPNGVPIVILHLAVELLGAVHNPLAIQFREHELDQVTRLLRTRLTVHPGVYRGQDYGEVHARTQLGRAGRALSVDRVLRPPLPGAAREVETSPADPSGAAFILNTSGTVAMKGVAHSHEEALFSTRTVAGIMGLGPDDVVVCAIPMTWGGGLCWGVRVALHAGSTLVSMERWDARRAAECIDREGGTFTYGPPTLARDLVDLAPEWRPRGPLSMVCAGAPIPRRLCADSREKLGMTLVPGYGQTEHLHSTLGRLDDPREKLTGTDGRPLPGVELRAVDEGGRPCPPESPGALVCRGPNVALGYYRQEDLSRETFRPDGWQVTQDLGVFDAQGYLRVVGRERDIIIRGGLNVSPREVEELLLKHPDVHDVAVVGYPDPRYGERICAFVVARGDAAPTVEELSAALAEMGVARYKHPERVEEIDALPVTTTGKVRREELRGRLEGTRAADQRQR